MTMEHFTTERERALIAEYRIAKKRMESVPPDQHQEFKTALRKCHELRDALKTEQSAKQRRENAVRHLDAPALEAKVYKGFRTVFIFLAIATLSWVYVSGDTLLHLIPTQVLLIVTASTGLIYFLGYICRTR